MSNAPVLEYRRLGGIPPHDLLRVHRPKRSAPDAARDVGQPGIRIQQRSLDLQRRSLVHPMPVDHVRDLEPCEMDIANALQLATRVVSVDVLADVSEDAVVVSLANVKSLAIPWIDESVDVRP